MNEQSGKPSQDAEAKLWEAIAAFETILEAFPNDRISLEALADAYEKIGDGERYREYGARLANVLIEESDEDAAREVLNKLLVAAPDDPRVKELYERLQTHAPCKVMPDVPGEDDSKKVRRSTNIAAEISFAWNLLQAGKLSQEDYSRVVHDLSEISTRLSGTPVSILHVLRDMRFPHMNAVLEFASSSCKTPVISLEGFDIQQPAGSLLPLSLAVERGALPFQLMGRDAMIAVLNPYNDQLQLDLETLTGRICHLFIAAPDDFDKALAKIEALQAQSENRSA